MEEDHMTSSASTDTGSGSVTMVTDSVGVDSGLDSDPRVLCNRVMVLQQNEVSPLQSDSCLINRIREFERSERSLLLQLYQLASASYLPSMQHSHRLDQRLRMLRDEVRNMTQEKERGERVWRERLQRCQRQLKAKEDEMGRQCQYFENFKTQLQQKLSLARDREQTLQTRVYTLEKQLLDMTVSAATGMTTISAVRITAGTVTHWEEQERLLSMRGEGEGEEERKEERKKQWQPSVSTERGGGQEGDEKEIQGGRAKDTKQNSNEARLEGFIVSLQEDLRVLLEREEDSITERRRLMEQLQENQEKNHFLGCKVEEMKAAVQQLKSSESSLMEEVEELREENDRLQEIVRDAANQTPSQSTTVPESTCPSPGTSSPSCNPAGSSGEVHQTSDEGPGRPHPSAVSPINHQAAAESSPNNKEDYSLSAKYGTLPKNDPLNLFYHLGTKTSSGLRSLSSTTETLGEFKLGNWCSKGILNLEESPSEESDALREACRSLGLGEDLEALQEQRDRLEVALQQAQEQLQVTAQENTQLKSQLRKEEQKAEAEQASCREKISTLPTSDGAEDNTLLTQDDLVQALNQENRALAERIQELLAHIELGEEEIKREETHLKERISQLEADRVKLEQENHEQGCLITELTKKTEDDLNTIMELQQMLVQSEHHVEESQTVVTGADYRSETSGSFQHNNLEECVDSVVESVLKETKTPSVSRPDDLTAAPGSQSDNRYNLFHNHPSNTLDVGSLTDQVGRLTASVHSLRSEEDELTGSVICLREQQREIALSVQTQTEVKQQLTRTVWGLKEEKDNVSQSLAGLKKEREQLTRTICGLKDERDQFNRSLSGLREEKEQLSKSLSSLRSENDKLIESLSSGKEERDLIIQSLQSLQTDSDQLSQTVLCLKQERDELTSILGGLRKERDEEQSSEDRDKLIKAVNSLREEKVKIEHSLACLKQEEEQTKQTLQALREERNKLQIALPGLIETEGRNQRQHLLNPNRTVTTKKTETETETAENNPQQYQTNGDRGRSVQQRFDGKEEQSDLMTEIEALGAELKGSQDELEKSRVDTETLRSELCQSESRREEAERKAADGVMRLTDVANQMEETKRENDGLLTQVKELQSKLRDLVREKSDALSLKRQTEEQHNILTVQLKAKTVALEELNSEYMALKRGQGGKDDLSAALISLRARYDDIRAKYDALLKKRSQKDVDVAPLKAKLSCLVVKCQERNSLLVQMMKAMRRRGGVDVTLAQQVEQLLSDSALQDYAAAFTPGTNMKTWDYSSGFTPGFISQFHSYSTGFTPDQTCCTTPPPVNQQHQNGLTPESEGKCRELRNQQRASLVASEATINQQACSSEVAPAPTGTPKRNTNAPAPPSPQQHHASVPATASPVPALPESFSAAQLSPSAKAALQAAGGPEKTEFHHPDIKGKSSPDPSGSSRSSLSRTPPSPRTRLHLSRRLSSPEKIINLHEQLQKTLKSSYQAPECRGRRPQTRRSLSLLPAQTDLGSASQTKQQILSFKIPQTLPVPLTAACSPAKHTPAVTAANKSATLFNAVASRSANITFSPNMFTQTKAVTSKTSASSFDFSAAKLAPSQSKSSSSTDATISPKVTKKTAATPDASDAKHTVSPDLTLKTSTFASDVLIRSDVNPKTTASETTAPSISTAPQADHFNSPSKADGAVPGRDGLVFDAQCSAKRSNKSARKFPAALENTKTARHQPGAPAEVRSVEVIKTVGQSGLMIGWERPPLDELGCSNGTFVYGYRVSVDGDFHKSVMSSACTKCVLENVDLSVPVHISVQTLGSNGLSSNSAQTTYRTSVTADHH